MIYFEKYEHHCLKQNLMQLSEEYVVFYLFHKNDRINHYVFNKSTFKIFDLKKSKITMLKISVLENILLGLVTSHSAMTFFEVC